MGVQLGDLVYSDESGDIEIREAMPDYSVRLRCRADRKDSVFPVRAFAQNPVVDGNGYVTLKIESKREELRRFVSYPYHFLDSGILCVLKFNRMKAKKSFALSSVMMSLDWKACLIFSNEGPSLFAVSRKDWEIHGSIGTNSLNSELNITMNVSHFSENSVEDWIDTYSDKIVEWINDCITKTTKKRKWRHFKGTDIL